MQNRASHPGAHYSNYFPGALSLTHWSLGGVTKISSNRVHKVVTGALTVKLLSVNATETCL